MNIHIEKDKLLASLKKRVHITQWITNYSKVDCVADLVSGLTLGLTIMPQSMAYASLANLPPHYGLYSSFMGGFVYTFFGSIKEVSIGPTSLMALLTLSYTKGLPIEFVILLCFLCGWVEFLMGIFKLGFLVDFISMPAISGFTTATSLTIILAQLKGLVGIRFSSDNIFHYAQKFYERSDNIKVNDLILGTCCIIILLIFSKFKDIKLKSPSATKALWLLSISRNALVVLVSSIIAFYFEHKYGESPFSLSGTVVSGIPTLALPKFSTQIGNDTVTFVGMVQKLGTGAIVLPVVAVLSNVAVAKAFSTGKPVDATQEMMTLGLCNILGSFVQSMPTCGAFTRSAVAHASGVHTPMTGVYVGTIILLALSFLTPYFYYVPKSSLSAVLISAVLFMIDYKIVPKLWKANKFELLVTVVTFIISLVFSVEQGLLVGVIINCIPLLKVWTRPQIEFSVKSLDKKRNYLLIKPELGLYYSASDFFNLRVQKMVSSIDYTVPLVIDFQHFFHVDYTSKETLKHLLTDLQSKNYNIIFLNITKSIAVTLEELIDQFCIRCCQSENEIFDELACTAVDIDDGAGTSLLRRMSKV
uniref:SLC26A/SulP transporter domain-containing protein n=1 Tax=Photinus pyralis TaxID=7054 RepID=A0A1Y1LT26_PHOPY